MKKLLGLILFVAVIAIAANYFVKGGLPFKQSLSAEEEQLARIRSDLRSAESDYRQAGRAAGVSGMDTSADAAAALSKVERIEKQLEELKSTLKSEVARQAADKLQEEISDFKSEIR